MRPYKLYLSVVLATTFQYSCNVKEKVEKVPQSPNILWIFLEDTAPLLSSYGTTLISTPNIDSLASQGVLYRNVFMPAPVCSASRSSIITGIMSTTTGTHNHHSSRTKESGIYLADSLETIPEIFKREGYFTFNNGKDDYNFIYNRKDLYSQDYRMHPLYGKNGIHLNLASLQHKQPFFGQIQLYGGKEIFSKNFKDKVATPVDRSAIELPPYLPQHPAIIEEYANHLDAIQITDQKVGKIIKELRDNDLLENTIVFFFSDHGMRITRNKQFLYDGGLHVPLIIADFTKTSEMLPQGSKNNDLISGLDLGTSALALADIDIPSYMEGQNIFSKSFKREYVISTRDRCDFTIDRIRSVRSKEFKYIRNFKTDRPYTQPTYMDFDGVEFVKVMHQLNKENKLDSLQEIFMSDVRPSEELYDLKNDPFELNNLAYDLKYVGVRDKYARILEDWISETDDKGQYPEDEENLKLMLGIWGEYASNPEYDTLREKYPTLSGTLVHLKTASSVVIDSTFLEEPTMELKDYLEKPDVDPGTE
ncbi:sulfatase [Flagellimonas sp.]|uniref:sulfatase family protein n=1 Tax=Flagellimonas sp. TaxID=2058762 RepID=UPI003B52263D